MRPRRSPRTALALALALGATPTTAVNRTVPVKEERGAGATIVRVDDHSGFDWADAGLGAAGGIALSALGAGLVLLVSERRKRPST